MSRRMLMTAIAGGALALSFVAGTMPAQATETAKPKQLKDYEEQFQGVPGAKDHRYKYSTNTQYWSVVAITMQSTTNLDLDLYSDKAGEHLIKTSILGQGISDFIAVDSNHRDFARYFPRVETVSGGGTYNIQLAQGADVLGSAPQEIDMTNDEVAAVRDTFLEAGTTYRFTLSPGSGVMDGDLFLMDSLPTTESTWVKSRSQAIDSASAPTGQPVVMEFTPSRTDWYGLVILRAGVFGTYDLARTII